MPARTSDDLQRVLSLLRGVIRLSELSQAEVDRRIRRRRGYLSHVFQQVVDLKLKDLLLVLDALDVAPERFFGVALDRAAPAAASASDVLALFQSTRNGRMARGFGTARRNGHGRTSSAGRNGGSSCGQEELSEQVGRVVREVLRELPPGSLDHLTLPPAAGN